MFATATKRCFGVSRRTFTTSLPGNSLIKKLPMEYLRESREENYHPVTRQRNDIIYDSNGRKLKHVSDTIGGYQVNSCSFDGKANVVIDWSDGISSRFSKDWISKTFSSWKQPKTFYEPWFGLAECDVRNSENLKIDFEDAITDEGMSTSILSLYKYGILLVTNTPTDDKGHGIAVLASALSGGKKKNFSESSLLANYRAGGKEMVLKNGTDGPLRTLFGKVWFTSSFSQEDGTSNADSAYTADSLPLHTDMTYVPSPPGLQIFTMIEPAERGGDSIYVDGINAAEILRSEDPYSFRILSTLDRKYQSIDVQTGWHLEAVGPIIEVRNGAVVRIRHNDLDRLPDLPPYNEDNDLKTYQDFYTDLASAHKKWDDILCRDENRLVINLKRGDTVVVANQVRQNCNTRELNCN